MSDAVQEYRERRAGRLRERGIVPAKRSKSFPNALLKQHEIRPSITWTTSDAWKALAEKGVNIKDVYRECWLRQHEQKKESADQHA